MSEPRPSFAMTENASGEGVALRQVNLGDAITNLLNGLAAFGFRDHLGQATMPTLTADARLPVSLDAAGDPKRAQNVVSGSVSGTLVTVASISLTPGKTYAKIHGKVSCRQPALFRLELVEDATVTVLEDAVLDAGEYNEVMGNIPLEVTAASGAAAASLRVRAYNFSDQAGKLSELRASVNCVEVVS